MSTETQRTQQEIKTHSPKGYKILDSNFMADEPLLANQPECFIGQHTYNGTKEIVHYTSASHCWATRSFTGDFCVALFKVKPKQILSSVK